MLPIRWSRVIVVAVALLLAVGSVLLILLRGSVEPSRRRGPALGPAAATVAPEGSATPNGTASEAGRGPASPATGIAALPGVPASAPASPDWPGRPAGLVGGRDARPSGPVLRLSRTVVDLGPVNSSDTVELVGAGTAPVDVKVGATPSWLRAVPESVRVAAGATVRLKITLDRAAAPIGRVDVSVPVTPIRGTGGGRIRVTATVQHGPQVVSTHAAPVPLRAMPCPAEKGPTVAVVSVTVVDPTGVFDVGLVTHLPDGSSTTTALTLNDASGDRSTWTGGIGPARATGTATYTATATSITGRRAAAGGSVAVEPCPGA
jgi:hypothetical protein